MSIHQEVNLQATPAQAYELLTSSEPFAEATGKPATIEAGEGDAFSIFGGLIMGRQIELVSGRRAVQAWRSADWEPGVYSVVRFTLTADGVGTKLVLDHEAYPEGKSPLYPTWHEHLSIGWGMFYFDPIARCFAEDRAQLAT